MARKIRIVSGRPYKAEQLGLPDEENRVWGVFVGGCVEDGSAWRLWREIYGHAHNDTIDPWYGWICILEIRDVLTPSGRPTSILLHELAHLYAPNQGHSAKWKRIVTELGAAKEIERIKKQPTLPSVERARKVERKGYRRVARRAR